MKKKQILKIDLQRMSLEKIVVLHSSLYLSKEDVKKAQLSQTSRTSEVAVIRSSLVMLWWYYLVFYGMVERSRRLEESAVAKTVTVAKTVVAVTVVGGGIAVAAVVVAVVGGGGGVAVSCKENGQMRNTKTW